MTTPTYTRIHQVWDGRTLRMLPSHLPSHLPSQVNCMNTQGFLSARDRRTEDFEIRLHTHVCARACAHAYSNLNIFCPSVPKHTYTPALTALMPGTEGGTEGDGSDRSVPNQPHTQRREATR